MLIKSALWTSQRPAVAGVIFPLLSPCVGKGAGI